MKNCLVLKEGQEDLVTQVLNNENMIKKIGVLTSGGDAPGMNAAIRAVVRTAIYRQIEVVGICRGYEGLIENDMKPMNAKAVSNIIQRGGTILKTARSERFATKEGRMIAYDNIKAQGIEGLIVIGGDGTFKGAQVFNEETNIPIIGIPGTIDNDIAGTHYTIGFDTAVNTAIEAIDKIRDTASAHNRVFVVEVMGRHSGLIALQSGVSCGAEDILVPEKVTQIHNLIAEIDYDKRRNKLMRIIVVCEGDDFGGAREVTSLLKEKFPTLDIRESVLGHIQRGGSPNHYDRWMASRFGYMAVNGLAEGMTNRMVGWMDGKMHMVPFDNNLPKYFLDESLLIMAKVLSI